jgi:dinuclear metal center YbgI/SA1388 family protein
MPTVQDVLNALESIAPSRFQFPYDKIGLQVGDPAQKVERAVVSLDRSLGAVEFVQHRQAQLLLSHHPLIFEPLASVDSRTHVGRTIQGLIRSGASFIAAHTNWDSAVGGVNDVLAEKFGLLGVQPFGSASEVRSLKLVVFCPEDAVDKVIDAASEAGAGIIGAYSRCAFYHAGKGTFLGGEASNPAVGQPGRVEEVDELRVEMVLPESRQRQVAEAVRRAHPYEEPAFDFFSLAPRKEQPAGRVGSLIRATTLAEFAATVDEILGTRCWAWGAPDKRIRRVAFVGGAADGDWVAAQRADADVFVTGEVRQHNALDASESGLAMIAAGHYATENPGAMRLADRLRSAMPDIEWLTFDPPSGLHGRSF